MYTTDQAIIQSFFYICRQTRRGYVRISQERMLEILKSYYQVDICRRTLNYHLRSLEDNSYIQRVRRHRRGEDGKILFHTSINLLKKKALQFIARLADYLRDVGWITRPAKAPNIVSSSEDFQKKMIQNYRLQFNSS